MRPYVTSAPGLPSCAPVAVFGGELPFRNAVPQLDEDSLAFPKTAALHPDTRAGILMSGKLTALLHVKALQEVPGRCAEAGPAFSILPARKQA